MAPSNRDFANYDIAGRKISSPNIKPEDIIRVRKKKKSAPRARWAVIALTVVCVVIGIVIISAAALLLYVNSLNKAMDFDDPALTSQLNSKLVAVSEESEPFYSLLLGSDARESSDVGRSDTIILVRADLSSGTITLVSIPRDTKVEIEGHGTQKINAAYAFGGAAGAIDAIQDFAGVEIAHYGEIRFEQLENLVDYFGGVWIDIPVSNDQTGSTNTHVDLPADVHLLDGKQALAFARERYGYTRGDYQRSDNQKLLVRALMDEITDESFLALPATMHQVASCIGTDLTIADMIPMAQALHGEELTVYTATVPSSTQTIGGVSYVIADEDAWKKMMANVDAGREPNKGL